MPERLDTMSRGAGRRVTEPGRGRLLIVNERGLVSVNASVGTLCRELAALGWTTRVLTVDEPTPLRWYALARSFHPNLARWRRRFRRMAWTPFAFKFKSWRYGRLIEKCSANYDVIVQCGGMFAPGWPLPTTPYAIVCDCTVKLGDGEPLSGVDFASRATAAKWYALEETLYRNAASIFSTSQYVTRSLIEDYGVEPDRAVTIGQGSSLEAPDGPDKVYDGKTILYVGFEFERKGGKVLLAAFERVAAEIPDAELLIAGPSRLERPLPRGVRLLGTVSRQELCSLYSQASLFVMPSLFEPFGLVFLEAMEHRLPCVGSDKCAIPEIIADGETGFITPAGDAGALAERIIWLLRRPDTMRHMGARGRERVHERFTWPAVARRIDARLVEIL